MTFQRNVPPYSLVLQFCSGRFLGVFLRNVGVCVRSHVVSEPRRLSFAL